MGSTAWHMRSVVVGVVMLLFVTVCHSVKIHSLKVPSTYTVDDSSDGDSDDLILDCEYEIGVNETGFVLKWLLKDYSIYQWIPNHKPYALTTMKGRIDTTYVASQQKYHKHRAVRIPQPLWNMTGEYTCHVQTFESSDKKSAFMQIIVPESDFQLTHTVDEDGMVDIRCSVKDVFPEPRINIVVGDSSSSGEDATEPPRNVSGLFEYAVERRLPKADLMSPTTINCILSLPGTNYTKKRETIFYDLATRTPIITTTTTNPDNANQSMANYRLEIDPTYVAADSGAASTTISTIAIIVSTLILARIAWPVDHVL